MEIVTKPGLEAKCREVKGKSVGCARSGNEVSIWLATDLEGEQTCELGISDGEDRQSEE